jgi:dienelactone hydrolase
VVVLHGTAGFDRKIVDLVEDLADNGYIAIAGCWFEGSHLGPDSNSNVELIDCPQAPQYSGVTEQGMRAAEILLEPAGRLEGAQSDSPPILGDGQDVPRVRDNTRGGVGVWGHGRGASVALNRASKPGTPYSIGAVVSVAGAYTDLPGPHEIPPIESVDRLHSPVLLIHGTYDNVVPWRQATDYALKLQWIEKMYEWYYFPQRGHAVAWRERETTLRVSVDFFDRHIKK